MRSSKKQQDQNEAQIYLIILEWQMKGDSHINSLLTIFFWMLSKHIPNVAPNKMHWNVNMLYATISFLIVCPFLLMSSTQHLLVVFLSFCFFFSFYCIQFIIDFMFCSVFFITLIMVMTLLVWHLVYFSEILSRISSQMFIEFFAFMSNIIELDISMKKKKENENEK